MSAAAVSKRHSPDPASEDSVDARTTRPHRKPLAAQSPRQRPERSCLAPRTAQHRAPQGLKWLSFTPDSGLYDVPYLKIYTSAAARSSHLQKRSRRRQAGATAPTRRPCGLLIYIFKFYAPSEP